MIAAIGRAKLSLPFAFCKQLYFHFPTAFDAVDMFRRATNSSKEISPSPSRSTSDTIALIAFPERKKGTYFAFQKKHGFEFWDPERSEKIRCERFATNIPDVNDILASPSACSFKIAASSSFVIRPSPSLSKTLKADHSTSFFKYCFWPQGDITWMSKPPLQAGTIRLSAKSSRKKLLTVILYNSRGIYVWSLFYQKIFTLTLDTVVMYIVYTLVYIWIFHVFIQNLVF